MPVTRIVEGVPVLVYSPRESYYESLKALEEFEERYSVTSETFYHHYLNGVLPAGMSLSEANDWAFMYRVYTSVQRFLEEWEPPGAWPIGKARPGLRGPVFSSSRGWRCDCWPIRIIAGSCTLNGYWGIPADWGRITFPIGYTKRVNLRRSSSWPKRRSMFTARLP